MTRGIAGPELDRAQFLATYGADEGETRWQLWQAHRAKAPAYALVRGKSPQALTQAKAAYRGDRTILERIEAEDAAERRRDPAGYGLTYAAGYRDAYEQAEDPADKAALLWDAQGQAGIPEDQRNPWTLEQSWDLARRWLAIEDGLAAAQARVDVVSEALMTLPEEQRPGGLAAMEHQGLDLNTPGRLPAVYQALTKGEIGTAHTVMSGQIQLGEVGAADVDWGTPGSRSDSMFVQLAQGNGADDGAVPPQSPQQKKQPEAPDSQPDAEPGWVQSDIERHAATLQTDLPPERQAAVEETVAYMAGLDRTEASSGAVANLPSWEARIDVLRALYKQAAHGKPPLSDSQIAAVRNIYASLAPDAAYRATAQAKEQAAFEAVWNDAAVRTAMDGWTTLDEAAKVKVFESVISTVMGAYGIEVIDPKTGKVDGKGQVTLRPKDPAAEGLAIYFQPASLIGQLGQIVYDMSGLTTNGPGVINDLMHELRHAYQQYYINQLFDDQQPVSNPGYAQIELFALSDVFYRTVTNSERGKSSGYYLKDPREADAHAQSETWNLFQQSKLLEESESDMKQH